MNTSKYHYWPLSTIDSPLLTIVNHCERASPTTMETTRKTPRGFRDSHPQGSSSKLSPFPRHTWESEWCQLALVTGHGRGDQICDSCDFLFFFFFSWLIHRWYMADIWIYKSCSHQTHQTWRYHSSMMMGWCLTWLRAPTTWQPPWQISLLTHPTVEWFQPTILVCLVVYTGDYLGGPFLHWSLWLNQWQMCIYI